MSKDDKVKGSGIRATDDEWLTREEAAERLKVSTRTFNRWVAKNPIDGTRADGSGPTARKLYPAASIDELVLEDEADAQQTAMSALMREVARASKEVHGSAALALDSAAKVIQGTNSRTSKLLRALLRENKRLGKVCEASEKDRLEVWALFKQMNETHLAELRAAALRERDRILDGVRNDALIKSMPQLADGLMYLFAPNKKTEESIMGQVLNALPPDVRQDITEKLFLHLPKPLGMTLMALLQTSLEREAKRVEAEQKNGSASNGAL